MRWHRMAGTSLPFLICTHISVAQAEERWTQFGLRPLAMGNAYVAVADDFNALFYNPAGLARLKSWDGEFLNPSLTVSKGLSDLVQKVQDSSAGSTSETLDLIEENTGESFHLGLGLTPHLIFPGFGFAIGMEMGTNLLFHRDISVDVDIGGRFIVPFVYAKNFLDDRLSVGIGLKARARVGIDSEFSIQDIEANKKDSENPDGKKIDDYVMSGLGIGTDVGVLFTPTKIMEPTIGISVTDLGATPYKKLSGIDANITAPTQLASVNVGMSMKPIQMDRLYLLTSVDMHSINQPTSFSKKFNLGTEVGYGSIIKLQAGLYQGYFTAGTQLDVGLINLRLLTYAEELGSVAGFKEDRRYALQLKILI